MLNTCLKRERGGEGGGGRGGERKRGKEGGTEELVKGSTTELKIQQFIFFGRT